MKFPGGSLVGKRGQGSSSSSDLRTVAVPAEGAFRKTPVGARAAFEAIYPMVAGAAARNRDDSCLLAIVDGNGALASSTILDPGEAATIGRHSQCRLRLAENDVSLRHLVAHVGARSSSGLPTLRLWDLKTSKAFIAEDGVSTEALAAEGPLFATLGSYTLALVPLCFGDGVWPHSCEDAWNKLPAREFIARLAEGTGTTRQGSALHVSRITHMGSTCSLEELSDPSLAVAEMHVLCSHRRRTYYLEARHLERGILIGRYSRCCNDAISDPAVSRVHMLLAASGREVYAIDTASTCGTHNDVGPIRCVSLPARAALKIGEHTTIIWKRHRTSQA